MWKLTIEDDEGKQIALPLAHDEYGIGRADTNAIRLTDRNVSRTHAALRRSPQGWLIRDTGSYNGTFVSGVRVDGEQPIQPGDIIQLGDYRAELVDDVAALAVPTGDGAAPPAIDATPPPTQSHHRPNRLVVVVGPKPGSEFPLDREQFAIGRSEDCSISINHSSVSRLHAELYALGNGRFEIVDKGSANGIRINGVELKRGIVEAGDALELGDVRLRYVGAGKIFRANLDPAHLAVGGFESVARSMAPGARTAPVGKLLGLGAVAMVVILGAVAVASRPPIAPVGKGEAANVVGPASGSGSGAEMLDAARQKLDQKDVDGAHQAVLQIPEASPLRDDPDVKKIEGAWADAMFQKVDAAATDADKKKLLKQISATATVDAARRKRASDMVQSIEAKEPAPQATMILADPPSELARLPGAGAPGPTGTLGAGDKATPPTPVAAQASGTPDENAMRKSLESRVWNGKASIDEIRLLKNICSHLGDRACRDRASGMLKKKLDAP